MNWILRRLGLVWIIALISVAMIKSAFAQWYSTVELLSTGTNVVAGPGTNTYTLPVYCDRVSQVAFQFKFRSMDTNTYDLTFNFSRSLDNSSWDATTEPITMGLASNGTNYVTYVTNLTVGPVGYLRLDAVVNTNESVAVTNLTVLYSIKRAL